MIKRESTARKQLQKLLERDFGNRVSFSELMDINIDGWSNVILPQALIWLFSTMVSSNKDFMVGYVLGDCAIWSNFNGRF